MTPRRLGNFLKMAAVTAAIFIAGIVGFHLAGNNFHAVIADEVYRSAQPSAEDIERFHTEYGIATIINLRGKNAGSEWYDREIKTSGKLGIAHIDFKMSASKELTPEQARTLIRLMQDAKKPLLIHCQAGADRTGLASALYLAAIAKKNEQTAEGQLSLRYGHVAIPVIGTAEMDWTFEKMEPHLGYQDS